MKLDIIPIGFGLDIPKLEVLGTIYIYKFKSDHLENNDSSIPMKSINRKEK